MISVIIPAFNEEKYIADCINSLKAQTLSEEFEIIVVDNNSTDDTKKVATAAGAKVIDEARQSTNFAKNAGAKIAKGDTLCFVDADCIVPKDHLEKISRIFDRSIQQPDKLKGVAACSGACIYNDGGIFIKLATDTFRYFYFYHKFIKLLLGYQSMSGANMIIRKEAFEKVGGFDEKMDNLLMPEDIDISVRLGKAGYKVLYLNSLPVYTSYRRYKGKAKKDWLVRLIETIKLARS